MILLHQSQGDVKSRLAATAEPLAAEMVQRVEVPIYIY
jgi:hypothetical protein